MLKYHGHAVTTSKTKGIDKYYLVVEYDKGMLAFGVLQKSMENSLTFNLVLIHS